MANPRMTKSRMQQLIDAGVIMIPENNMIVQEEMTELPVVADPFEEAKKVVETAKTVAEITSTNAVTQAQAMESVVSQLSDALRASAEKKEWKRIKVRFERDRNQMLRTAEFERLEDEDGS